MNGGAFLFSIFCCVVKLFVIYLTYQTKQKAMNTQEIYNLANQMTEEEASNVVFGWERDNDIKSLELYNNLIQLGDSKQLACASVIAEKANDKGISEMYQIAYCS